MMHSLQAYLHIIIKTFAPYQTLQQWLLKKTQRETHN